MRRIGATVLILLVGAMPSLADEVPTRKAGLWEIKTENGSGVSMVIHQCVDAATDFMMQSPAAAFDEAACPKPIVQLSGHTLTIDKACKIGGGRTSVTSHVVVTGSLDSAYTMTGEVESRNEALPGGKLTMTLTGAAKWLGPCAAGQKPGDWIVVPRTQGNGETRP